MKPPADSADVVELREQASVVVRSICDFLGSLLLHAVVSQPRDTPPKDDKVRRILSLYPAECSRLQMMSLHSKLIADLLVKIEGLLTEDVIKHNPTLLINVDLLVQFIVYKMQNGLLSMCLAPCVGHIIFAHFIFWFLRLFVCFVFCTHL